MIFVLIPNGLSIFHSFLNFDMYLWINKMIEALYALMGINVQL